MPSLWAQTQGFIHASQTLYQLCNISALRWEFSKLTSFWEGDLRMKGRWWRKQVFTLGKLEGSRMDVPMKTSTQMHPACWSFIAVPSVLSNHGVTEQAFSRCILKKWMAGCGRQLSGWDACCASRKFISPLADMTALPLRLPRSNQRAIKVGKAFICTKRQWMLMSMLGEITIKQQQAGCTEARE